MSFHITRIFDDAALAEKNARKMRVEGKKQVRVLQVQDLSVIDKRPASTTEDLQISAPEGKSLFLVQYEDVPAPKQPTPTGKVTLPEP